MDLTTVLLIVLAYYLGKFIIAWLDLLDLKHQINRASVVTVLDRIIREVKVEKYHGLNYWFDKENDRFLAQGSDMQEIVAVLKDRFPDNVFVLPNGKILGAPTWTLSDKTDAKITQEMFDRFLSK